MGNGTVEHSPTLLSRYENRTQIDIKDFVAYVLKAKSEVNYDGTIDGWDQQWSTPNAILFTVSIMTIVGYGNISPKTVNAQEIDLIGGLGTFSGYSYILDSL